MAAISLFMKLRQNRNDNNGAESHKEQFDKNQISKSYFIKTTA